MIIGTLLSFALAASSPARDTALAEEYLKVAGLDRTYEAIIRDGEAELDASVDEAPCDAVKPILRERNAEIKSRVRGRLMSKTNHLRLVTELQAVFSDDELRQLIEFMRTPLGRTLVERTPRLVRAMTDLAHGSEADAEREFADLEAKYSRRFEQVREECEAQMPDERPDDAEGMESPERR